MAWTEEIPHLGALALTVLALSACSVAGPRESPLPKGGATMNEIYRGATMNAEREHRVREALPLRPPGELSPGPVKESALRQIEHRFPRMPNPDLVMVVFPHLARGKYPVPGYFTAFPMYEQVEYLLPGEGTARLEPAPSVQR
ncbi:MAG: TIGR03751 family conjugal transfer lipoprotein [Rhodocyclaceae bacterium]|nr:TIGR03751 family conjugal transfer lipoprotein [Rhodocyclaceae bacterium]